MVWLPDGEKIEDIFIRFDTMHERDRQTHTKRHTHRHTVTHCIRDDNGSHFLTRDPRDPSVN